MRRRTFILLISVLVVAVAAVLLIIFLGPDDGPLASILPGRSEPAEVEEAVETEAEDSAVPVPTPTPEVRYVSVVVARADLPIGERITNQLVELETRPEENWAVQGGYTFSEPEQVVGKIVRTDIGLGQEILAPMLALNPNDIVEVGMGSDLSLYIDRGKVAVAFPINSFSGAAYAIRPGDLVDAFMSLTMVDLDEEFQTELPNITQRVSEVDLLEGKNFLFPPTTQGRLELIPLINSVATIGPGVGKEPIPRRVTQLTLQQMEALWVGSWRDPRHSMEQEYIAEAELSNEVDEATANKLPEKDRPEDRPDVIILSMTSQDALALKWALETGIDIDLVLRSQGDVNVFTTTSVSLPLLLEQGWLSAPEPSDVGLQPRVDEVPSPFLPDSPP